MQIAWAVRETLIQTKVSSTDTYHKPIGAFTTNKSDPDSILEQVLAHKNLSIPVAAISTTQDFMWIRARATLRLIGSATRALVVADCGTL
jgi:hypothetical protein